MTPLYRLKKATPELKKGAILKVEGCYVNGDYHYECKDKWFLKDDLDNYISYSQKNTEEQPKWFEKVNLFYVTKEQKDKVKKLLKK